QSDETRCVHVEVRRERATRTLVPIRYRIQATVTLGEWLQGKTRKAQPGGLYLGLLPDGELQPAHRQEVRGRAEVQINVGAPCNGARHPPRPRWQSSRLAPTPEP